jgi:hypothetical protein
MADKKSPEVLAIEQLATQQEMTNRLLALALMRIYPPLFPASVVAKALSETTATPAEIARLVPGITSRSIATIKCAKEKNPDSTLERKPTETEGRGRETTGLGGVDIAVGGANGAGTEPLSIINIENSASSGDSHTINSVQGLGAKEAENEATPERVLDRKSVAAPSPREEERNG